MSSLQFMRRRANEMKDIQAWSDEHGLALEVTEEDNGLQTIYMDLHGPKDSLYEGGVWRVRCQLPARYPIKSPSVSFKTKVWHPNIERSQGGVCLNILKENWTPAVSIRDIYELYLPQLLQDPEPSDPFNTDAASMYMRDKAAYDAYVRKYVEKYAMGKDPFSVSLPSVLRPRRVRSDMRTPSSMAGPV